MSDACKTFNLLCSRINWSYVAEISYCYRLGKAVWVYYEITDFPHKISPFTLAHRISPRSPKIKGWNVQVSLAQYYRNKINEFRIKPLLSSYDALTIRYGPLEALQPIVHVLFLSLLSMSSHIWRVVLQSWDIMRLETSWPVYFQRFVITLYRTNPSTSVWWSYLWSICN